MDQSDIAGEYYLQGVHEMASGFLLKPDFSFQFFFSYGALDRSGEGEWTIEKKRLVLTSLKIPTNDFELVQSSKTGRTSITLKIDEANPVLRKHVYASLENGKPGSWISADRHGEINFPVQNITTVSLLLEFCPERITTLPVKDKDHDLFLFRILAGIMEVHFNKFSVDILEGQLKGRHPLLEGEQFVYMKNK